MYRRKGLARVAACVALACGGLAQVAAADSSVASTSTLETSAISSAPVLLDDAALPARPLTALLNATPLGKPLSDAGISISGFVEGSWTYTDHQQPGNNTITGRAFDNESESILLNQLDLAVSRTVDTTKKKFDIGFNVEQIYGADGAVIHANGLTTYSPSKILGAYTSSGTRQPKNQYDLNQAYLTFALPIGKGLGITLGKFDTLLGYEVIDAPSNPLFSHSFLFTQLPLTQTGVLVSYNLSDSLVIQAGVTRGWDQALDDTNGSLDVLGNVAYTMDKWKFTLNYSSGDQRASAAPGFPGLDGWRTVFDLIATYAYSDNLSLAVNADYGFEPQVDNGDTGQWYGVALYAGYTLTENFTLNLRGEWFDDPDGRAPASFTGAPNQYYEGTLGVKITLFPKNNILSNFVIRPEVRVDYADHPTWRAGLDHTQLTAAVEAYFNF